jgi:hypothetical protein
MMPSSTSSSDPQIRPVPALAWGRVLVTGILLIVAGLGCWEMYWRSQEFTPSYRNSDGLWAMTRNRIDREGPGGIAVVSSSRLLFDLHLEAWKEQTGTLPVQLALEGTDPRPFLTHLAQETDYNGLVVVGVAPPLFFTPDIGLRASVLEYYRNESPSQWASQRISMAVEPYVAFYSFDAALFTVLRRQNIWPAREVGSSLPVVRKLSNMQISRQSPMWSKLEHDTAYRDMARNTWLQFLNMPRELPPLEVLKKGFEDLLASVKVDVDAIRARGGEVVFVRAPSTGPFREAENGGFPRERMWDVLLEHTGTLGVHFEDHADLQDVELPEWSHIRAGDTEQFTLALIGHIRRGLDARGTPRAELEP